MNDFKHLLIGDVKKKNINERVKELFFPPTKDEVNEYSKNCETILYKYGKFLLLNYIRSSLFRLTTNVTYESTSFEGLKDSMCFVNPIKEFQDVNKSWFQRTFRLACINILIYLSVKFYLLSYHQYDYDYQFMNLKIFSICNRTIDYDEYEKDIENYQSKKEFLDFIGNPMQSLTYISPQMFGLAPTMLITFFLPMFMITHKGSVRADYFAFVVDPIRETNRVKSLVNYMIEDLKHSLENHSINHAIKTLSTFCVSESGVKNINDSIMNPGSDSNRLRRQSICTTSESKTLYEKLYNIQFNLINLVLPANLWSDWHRVMVRTNIVLYAVAALEGGLVVSLVVTFAFLSEIRYRIANRIDLINCISHSNNTFHLNLIRLGEFSNQEYEAIYLNYLKDHSSNLSSKNSLIDLIGLYDLALIEVKEYLTLPIILTWLEFIFLLDILACWTIFYTTSYHLGQIDRLYCVEHIKRQIECCTDLIIEHVGKEKSKLSDKHKNDKLLLENCLSIAFLNYTTLKKEHAIHQRFMNIQLMQIFLITLACLGFVYLSRKVFVDDHSLFMLICASVSTLLLNLLLVSSALQTGQQSHLMKSIVRLVSSSSNDPALYESNIIQLWSRHIMSETEIQNFYAPEMFEIQISYSTIFSMNTYLAMLWYVFLYQPGLLDSISLT